MILYQQIYTFKEYKTITMQGILYVNHSSILVLICYILVAVKIKKKMNIQDYKICSIYASSFYSLDDSIRGALAHVKCITTPSHG